MGKRKVEQYGEAILSSIREYKAQNPRSPPRTGEWVRPKKAKLSAGTLSDSSVPQTQPVQAVAKSITKVENQASRTKAPALIAAGIGTASNPELISLDTDSDDPGNVDADPQSEKYDEFGLTRPTKRRKVKSK